MITLLDGAPNETSEGEALLTFEKAIALDRPSIFVWAPDNRHVAISNLGRLLVVDVDNPSGSGRPVADKIGLAVAAWSPDGAMLALSQSAPVSCVRVIDTATGGEIVRRETSLQQRYQGFLFSHQPITFTPDGRALWVANEKIFPGHHNDSGIALKLDIRTLEALDRFDAPLPMAGERTSFDNLSFSHDNGSTQLLYTATAVLLSERTQGRPPRKYFAYGYDLETKRELFPKMPIAEDNRSGFFREPRQLLTLPDKRSLLVRLDTGIGGRPGIPHHPEFDRQVEIYDCQSGQLIAHYLGLVGASGQPEIPEGDDLEMLIAFTRSKGSEVERGVVGNIVARPDRNFAIGWWNSALIDRGGLVVIDPLTGRVRQRIIGMQAGAIALSPNGKCLALIAKYYDAILFYSVN